MLSGREKAFALLAMIESQLPGALADTIDIRAMREGVIKETLIFISELDAGLRTRGFGSIEVHSDVRRETRMLEVRLHVVLWKRSKVLKFGVHETHIHVGGQRATDEITHSGPIFSEDELIHWLSQNISGML